MRMAKDMAATHIIGLVLAASAALAANGDVVWRETFDDPSTITNW